MNVLSIIFLKIFSLNFYRQHAGLFLFTFLILIGAVEPGQLVIYHYSLILGISTSKTLLALVCGFWLLYYTKALFYILKEIDQPENAFLFYSATKFGTLHQFRAWLVVILVNSFPVLLYAVVTALIAVKLGYFGNAWLIFGFNAICCLSSGYCALKHSNRFIAVKNRLISTSKIVKSQRIYLINIFRVFHDLKVSFLITKGLSYFFIIGLFLLFKDVSNDVRVAAIIVLASGTSHSFLVLEMRKFEEIYCKIFRNFGYSKSIRFGCVLFTYAVLLLPESIWLFARFNVFEYIPLSLFLLSIPVLFHSLTLVIGFNVKLYLKSVFGIFIILFLLIMFKLLYLTILAILVTSILIFNNLYYKFE